MDRDNLLICDVTSGPSEENHVDSESGNTEVLCQLPQLNNSFGNLEEELGKKGLPSHVAEHSDRPLEVMGIENTW
jgi:hypothetical protein